MSANNSSTQNNATTNATGTRDSTPNNSGSEADTCVVCFKNVDIYSIGECDHPVCHECSTRMRVLCQQNECPICRQVLGKVIFTYDKLPYRELEAKNRSEYFSKKYKIGFYNNDIQKRFFELLDHPCPKCNTLPYRSFQGLRDHVRREHNLHYCDLCVDNLKIFTFERRCYTQAELGLHRTKGDPDNKSHRGHPLCEYCNKRFLDRDELFRHLRREHYFCHFCDADGCNEFYKDYDALAEHFRQDHYLCEEGKCATEQFVGAFRTEIDFKAHVASVHGKTLNKQQAKQTRTLQLEITLGPRGRGTQVEQNIHSSRNRNMEHQMEDYELLPSFAQNQNQRNITIDSQNEQDFPSLGGGSGPSGAVQPLMPFPMRRSIASGLACTKENFPALGGGGSGGGGAPASMQRTTQQQQQRHGPPISSMLKKNVNSTPNNPRQTQPQTTTATVTNSSGNNNSGVVIHVSNRPMQSSTANSGSGAISKKSNSGNMGMDFPALPTTTAAAGKSITNFPPMGKNRRQQPPQQQHHIQKQQQQQHVPQSQFKQQHDKQYERQLRAALEEDMLPSAPTNPNVAAKHRTLVDDYVSVANPKNFQKIQMVQQEEAAEQARKKAAADRSQAPKLTSEEFPTLGGSNGHSGGNGGGGASVSSNWTKPTVNVERKQRELENRKAKIAPPPLLSNTREGKSAPQLPQSINKTTTKNANNTLALSATKEKKNKEKKAQEASSNQNQNPKQTQNSSSNLTKSNNKVKDKERNNNNNHNNNNNNNNNENKPNSNSNTTTTKTTNSLNNDDAAKQLRPPPGFIGNNASGGKNQPPPGFLSNVTVNSVAKSPNNLTFTSSMGESYSIIPKHKYVSPPDSAIRNQKLVEEFQNAMSSYEGFQQFHLISLQFREGVYKADAYYEHCQSALKDQFDKIFPELLVLLPDISKQQALYLVHTQRLKSLPPAVRESLPQLEVCPVCKQVLVLQDLMPHQGMHEFPTLKGGLGNAGKSASTTKRK